MAWKDVEKVIKEEKMSDKLNNAVLHYLRLRDDLDEMRRKHNDEQAQLRAKMQTYEDAFAKILDKVGVDSFACPAATIFHSTKTSATVSDWTATLDYIREHEAWHLLEQRVNKTAAMQIAEEEEHPVPGVTIKTFVTTNIRRK